MVFQAPGFGNVCQHDNRLGDGTLVIAGMQINNGVAEFDGYQLRTDMTGPFVGEALINGARTSLQGNGRIRFGGTRAASR